MPQGEVIAVGAVGQHRFSKTVRSEIRIIAGLGVEGDAHCGITVKHRSRVKVDPAQPNLRQVHLIHGELLDELNGAGFHVEPGELGENVMTSGIDLLGLPRGARLRLGETAVVELTGLRNPCAQIEQFQSGLLAAVLDRTQSGKLVRKAGLMAIALESGAVKPGDPIVVTLPSGRFEPLEPV